ncbi:MAG: EF-P lysine aminoacylase EpmA [Kiritimatiellia bacterium]
MILPQTQPLMLRHHAAQAIRSFFLAQGFCEVDTPIRIPCPAPELHILPEPAGTQFLRTSPELHMKRILAAGCDAIFQLGPCFRAQEYGSRHRPEFTMLEWYRRNADYMTILADMQALLPRVVTTIHAHTPQKQEGGSRSPHTLPDFDLPWEIHTIREIFRERASWDPVTNFDPDRFDLDMVNIIEPSLPHDRCSILIDYPVSVAALARRNPDNPLIAERWELYAGGLELANAFSELTDPTEQRQRFEQAIVNKNALGEPTPPIDEAFLHALEYGLPPCAGVALGFDRLLMASTGAQDISAVLPFPRG